MPRLVFISDTHSQLNKMDIPDGDILLHSGDATFNGTDHEIMMFNEHLRPLKKRFKKIYYTPGNHDLGFQDFPDHALMLLPNATVLIDTWDVFEGLKIFGSPWQPWFWDWAYNFPQYDGGVKAKETWAKIPVDTHILITHGPPFGIADKLDEHGSEPGKSVGCPHLRNRLFELPELKVHSFGHIHCGYGVYDGADYMMNGTTFVNAASCTEKYKPTNPPIVIDL